MILFKKQITSFIEYKTLYRRTALDGTYNMESMPVVRTFGDVNRLGLMVGTNVGLTNGANAGGIMFELLTSVFGDVLISNISPPKQPCQDKHFNYA